MRGHLLPDLHGGEYVIHAMPEGDVFPWPLDYRKVTYLGRLPSVRGHVEVLAIPPMIPDEPWSSFETVYRPGTPDPIDHWLG